MSAIRSPSTESAVWNLKSISQQHSTGMGDTCEDLQVLTAFTSALSSLLQKTAELVNRITA